MRRIIFLVDMNAFFISCETTRRPELAGVPAAVAGDPAHRSGIILAANYEARKYGVRTTMVLHEAKRLCPSLILVPPSHGLYEEMSGHVMDLLSRFSPLIEPNSIDEAWLDMTGCELLSGAPRQAAEAIMAGIRDELGLWCSIGIAENKYLAKMAADMKKPMGITELWQEDVERKMWPLPVGELLGAGKKTVERMNRFGVMTIGDLARMDQTLLFKRFGRGGIELQMHALGQDDSPVQPPRDDEMKSIGKSTTLIRDAASLEEVKPVLMQLAEEVAASARRHGKKGRVVQISIKYADFTSVTRQTSISATFATEDILRTGLSLLTQHWEAARPIRLIGISLSGFGEEADQISMFELPGMSENGAGTANTKGTVSPDRSVNPGVSVSPDRSVNPSVSVKPNAVERHKRGGIEKRAATLASLDATMDSLRERFGTQSVKRASLMRQAKVERHGVSHPENPDS